MKYASMLNFCLKNFSLQTNVCTKVYMKYASMLNFYSKTPKYKTPALVKISRSLQLQSEQEKKRLTFDCCEESNNTQAGQFCATSPGEGENIEEKLQECLLQLEKVRQFDLVRFRVS